MKTPCFISSHNGVQKLISFLCVAREKLQRGTHPLRFVTERTSHLAGLWIGAAIPNTSHSNDVRRPGTIEQLKEAIRQEVAAIPPAMTRKAMDNFRERLQEFVINNGRHLRDVIFKSV